MTQHSLSCVRLVNMVFYAHHGVLREEHTVGAKYEVDAELFFDYTDAAKNDDITKTIDYGAVYRKIRAALTLRKFFLIEAVAYEIAHELLLDFPVIERLSIRVRKRNPPVDGICDYAEADYTTSRH
ncbi:dihydroneopterin aldolase [Chlorobium ferrooxidans]|uniref:7,8-dihydroneopterin aldolase n=1 Tax=Chlorobium ferrooxidans DSM 13031 TaxID=377431 RepID=Q0YRT6_9CHLB|nr:dihydroneopterin aldolase [Chlorobium ferrooxidans]EAT59051.1 dihydroneopterin aldolase [Chlorobium ferrooxidans DSM 13031]